MYEQISFACFSAMFCYYIHSMRRIFDLTRPRVFLLHLPGQHTYNALERISHNRRLIWIFNYEQTEKNSIIIIHILRHYATMARVYRIHILCKINAKNILRHTVIKKQFTEKKLFDWKLLPCANLIADN